MTSTESTGRFEAAYVTASEGVGFSFAGRGCFLVSEIGDTYFKSLGYPDGVWYRRLVPNESAKGRVYHVACTLSQPTIDNTGNYSWPTGSLEMYLYDELYGVWPFTNGYPTFSFSGEGVIQLTDGFNELNRALLSLQLSADDVKSLTFNGPKAIKTNTSVTDPYGSGEPGASDATIYVHAPVESPVVTNLPEVRQEVWRSDLVDNRNGGSPTIGPFVFKGSVAFKFDINRVFGGTVDIEVLKITESLGLTFGLTTTLEASWSVTGTVPAGKQGQIVISRRYKAYQVNADFYDAHGFAKNDSWLVKGPYAKDLLSNFAQATVYLEDTSL